MLINGDGGCESGYRTDFRCFGFLQELPGIGSKGGKVFALGFAKDDIKNEGRFSGPRNTGNNNQLVFRYFQGNRPQVVLRSLAD